MRDGSSSDPRDQISTSGSSGPYNEHTALWVANGVLVPFSLDPQSSQLENVGDCPCLAHFTG